MKSAFIGTTILVVTVCLIGCSKPSPEEYLAKATAAVDSSKFTLAIQAYEDLIKDHPASLLVEEAMFKIASIRNDNLHDFPGAIEAYKRYTEKYPQGKQGPIALFLTAYLYNNELHDLANAKIAYEKFLATYPNHEMASSADFELKHLGKTPEELLPGIQQSTQQTAAQTSSPKPIQKSKKK